MRSLSFACPARTTPAPPADATERWARALVDMPDWVVAASYDYTLPQARRIRFAVASLLADLEAGR